MNPILDGYRQRFSNVAAYRPGASPGGGPDGRLSSNESAWGPSPGARAAAAAALGQLHRYPDNSRARAALARYAGVDPASLLVTNGSDEACYLIAALGLRPGSLAIASDPG
ncbi:MAG: histidinol-phosphate transaminase, partial [Acidimicrobiales bacterium]